MDNNILATIHSVINKSAYRASEQSRPRRDESEERGVFSAYAAMTS